MLKTCLIWGLVSAALGIAWIVVCISRKPINLEPTAGDPRD